MGKASKGKPKPTLTKDNPMMEGLIKLIFEFKESNRLLQGQAEAVWKEAMLHRRTWQEHVEHIGGEMAALAARVDGLEERLTEREAVATPVAHLDEEKEAEKSALTAMEGHWTDMAKRVEAMELRLEEAASTTVSSDALSTSSTREACAKGVRGGRRTHQPKTPTKSWECGK